MGTALMNRLLVLLSSDYGRPFNKRKREVNKEKRGRENTREPYLQRFERKHGKKKREKKKNRKKMIRKNLRVEEGVFFCVCFIR